MSAASCSRSRLCYAYGRRRMITALEAWRKRSAVQPAAYSPIGRGEVGHEWLVSHSLSSYNLKTDGTRRSFWRGLRWLDYAMQQMAVAPFVE